MKHTRKIICIALCIISIALLLCGCGKNKVPPADETVTTGETTTEEKTTEKDVLIEDPGKETEKETAKKEETTTKKTEPTTSKPVPSTTKPSTTKPQVPSTTKAPEKKPDKKPETTTQKQEPTVNNYKTLELVNNNWVFRTNGNYGRVHFTPLWYPDGEYVVHIQQSDMWTPAGMITQNINTNQIKIKGSAYDDWYID